MNKEVHHVRLAVTAFALAVFMLLARLGHFPLLQPDEGRNAEVAREMHVSGNWLVPLLEDQPYLDKPAFFFRAAALCFDVLGVSEGAARLPSALSGLAVVTLAWLFARKRMGSRVASLSVMIIVTSPIFVAFSRLVIMDMTLAVFVVAAIFAGALAEEEEGRRRTFWLAVGAGASGLGTVVKGPVGFILPLLVLVVWHLVEKRRVAIRRLFGWIPVCVFWATALPWFIGLSLACPDFPHYGLVEESFKRFSTAAMKRTQPFFFYGYVIPGALFAWSILVPEAAWRLRQRIATWTRWDRLCLVWCLILPAFFSLSKSKQPGYILTVAVPAALLVARLFDAAWSTAPSPIATKVLHRGNAILTSCLAVLALATGLLAMNSGWADRLVPPSDRFSAPSFVPLALSLAVVVACGVAAWRTRRTALYFITFAGLLPTLATGNFPALANYARQRSCVALVEALAPVATGREVVTFECMPSGLPFYLGTTVPYIDTDCAELGSNYILYSLKKTATWPAPLVQRSEADAWLRRQTNELFFVAQTRRKAELEQFLGKPEGSSVPLTSKYVGLRWKPAATP